MEARQQKPRISALRVQQRQNDCCQFNLSLVYIPSSRPARATQKKPVSTTKNTGRRGGEMRQKKKKRGVDEKGEKRRR